jgi:hypothetical protein
MLVARVGYIPATLVAFLQEVLDLVTILAALRAVGSRRDDVVSARAPRTPEHVAVG